MSGSGRHHRVEVFREFSNINGVFVCGPPRRKNARSRRNCEPASSP